MHHFLLLRMAEGIIAGTGCLLNVGTDEMPGRIQQMVERSQTLLPARLDPGRAAPTPADFLIEPCAAEQAADQPG